LTAAKKHATLFALVIDLSLPAIPKSRSFAAQGEILMKYPHSAALLVAAFLTACGGGGGRWRVRSAGQSLKSHGRHHCRPARHTVAVNI